MSLLLVLLYCAPIVASIGLQSLFIAIDWTAVALPLMTLGAAVIGYFIPPKRAVTLGIFILLLLTAAHLVVTTGSTQSPFIALWIAVAVFSGIFGIVGYSAVLLLVAAYVSYLSMTGSATNENLLVAIVAGVAPLIASFIIWHTKGKEDKRDKAYMELASELSHESNRSETVINAINDGVLSVDKKGTIQLINPAAERIIGWTKGDAMRLSYKSVLKLNDRDDKPVTVTNDPIEQVLTTSQEIRTEDLSIQTESGRKVLLSVVVSPIGKPVTGAIIVFRDITKEKSEEREQAEFISTASHEMRTPVASIEGYLGLVLNPATATIDDKAREYVTKAQASAQHLGRLFQDLLDVSKAEDGRMANTPKVVDVVEYIADIVEGMRPKAVEKQLRFIYKPRIDEEKLVNRLVAPVYYANVDNDHLREVVANLIENAIKYTPQGDVIVDVGSDGDKINISVQDSGIGIPAEDIPHLFQKFYRVDNSDTREIGGTGLGLYLCRRLAEVMGGQIKLESTYKAGSTFTLEIPRIDHQEAQRLVEAASIAEDLKAPSSPLPVQPAPMPLQNTLPTPNDATGPLHIPAPQAQQTQYEAPQQQANPAQQDSTQGNVSISEIEQNPAAYTTGRAPVVIPPREAGQRTDQA